MKYDLNLNDALAVMSVILNRCDSKSWAKWAGPSPYDQVVMKGQFEVYFAGYYLDFVYSGIGRNNDNCIYEYNW